MILYVSEEERKNKNVAIFPFDWFMLCSIIGKFRSTKTQQRRKNIYLRKSINRDLLACELCWATMKVWHVEAEEEKGVEFSLSYFHNDLHSFTWHFTLTPLKRCPDISWARCRTKKNRVSSYFATVSKAALTDDSRSRTVLELLVFCTQ